VSSAPTDPIGSAFVRLYNFDFPGAHLILDAHLRASPADPLGHAVRAAAYLFSELDRLGILESQFLTSDQRLLRGSAARAPDARTRRALFQALAETRARAGAVLKTDSGNAGALFAMALATGIEADYAALVEKRRLGSLSYARQSQSWAVRLLKAQPDFSDAYLTAGINEYLVGSLPFLLRWFIRFDQVEGDKGKAVEHLKRVAATGRYLGPFAKILLAILYLREHRPAESAALLEELSREFPQNPLFPRELARLRNRSQ
jgi:predicted Zn-dependent protease